jgi:hypothetical protein
MEEASDIPYIWMVGESRQHQKFKQRKIVLQFMRLYGKLDGF